MQPFTQIVKKLIASNEFIVNFFASIFKHKLSIKVKNKDIICYMNPTLSLSQNRPNALDPAIDINGEYEGPFLTRLIDDMLNFTGKINYFDIGGSFGFDVVLINSFLGERAFCYTFEPDKFMVAYLKNNTRGMPCKIIEKFVSDTSGANSITIDDFCQQESVFPTHIKIDIEGAEILALKGMLNILREYKPKLYVEFHEIFIKNRLKMDQLEIDDFFKTLENLGYTIEFNSHHYPLFSKLSTAYDYQWFAEPPNSMLYAVICT